MDAINLVEQPLGYWEKNSYMLAVTDDDLNTVVNNFFSRISKIEGLEVKEKQELTSEEPGQATIIYEDEEYFIGFYPTDFSLPELYLKNNYYFSNEEAHKLRNANKAFTIFMKFNNDCKKSYHLQIKLLVASVTNLLGILDESAERMLPGKWAYLCANTITLPGANDLYNVQAINTENGEVWLHTHGLCRCGITELEIIKSDNENCYAHYNLISTFASYLLDLKRENKEFNGLAYLGFLRNKKPILATYLIWTKGLEKYDNLDLGGIEDRKEGHNSKTSIIFLYDSDEDAKNGKLEFVNILNGLINDNPLFLRSNEETEIMRNLAKERFKFVKEQAQNKENKIDIKIALPIDDEENEYEHIWFNLIEFEGDKFKAKLTQEPYNVKSFHIGDESVFSIDDVTDWVIYTKKFSVNPSSVYLLD